MPPLPLSLRPTHETPLAIAQATQSNTRTAAARSRYSRPTAAVATDHAVSSDSPTRQQAAVDDPARMHTPAAAATTMAN